MAKDLLVRIQVVALVTLRPVLLLLLLLNLLLQVLLELDLSLSLSHEYGSLLITQCLMVAVGTDPHDVLSTCN